MKKSTKLSLRLLVVAGVAGNCGWAIAQAPAPASQVGNRIPVVELTTIITGKSDHALDDVTGNEVQIFEDGKPQQLEVFARAERPVRYAIAFDASLSFRSVFAAALAASGVIVSENKAEDESALIRFVSSDKISILQDFTADKTLMAEALKRLHLEAGQTALIDALYYAVESVAAYKPSDLQARRAVVVITDGEDRQSVTKVEALIKLLRDTNVQVFVIGMVDELEKDYRFPTLSAEQKAVELLTRIAKESGGRAFFVRTSGAMEGAAKEIAHDLRVQYAISYRRPSDQVKGFHKIEIKSVGKRKFKAITRPGYVVN